MKTKPACLLASIWIAMSGAVNAQSTTRVSLDSNGQEAQGNADQPSISVDGRYVAFWSDTAFVPQDTNGYWDVYVRDLSTGLTTIATIGFDGSIGVGNSDSPCLSDDGQFVAFTSFRSNLVQGDQNGVSDLFLRDLVNGTNERVSVGTGGLEANDRSYGARLSTDLRYVAFQSFATNLDSGDANGYPDIFVRDRQTDTTIRVSVNTTGGDPDSESGSPTISADGRFVAFDSWASNLIAGDGNGSYDVFVRDLATNTTTRASVDSTGNEAETGMGSFAPALSADGRIVVFESFASNLVPNDTNGTWDVFAHDLLTGETTRLSVDSSGQQSNDVSKLLGGRSSISANGQLVVFTSYASNLVPGDTNGVADVFVHDRTSHTTTRASVASDGTESDAQSIWGAISADGESVVFSSGADNLVQGDANGTLDVFVRDLCPVDATWSNYGVGFPGTNGVPSFTAESNPVLGASLTLNLANSSGTFTVGLLFVGFQQTSVHSGWGGDLLVVPAIATVVGLAPSGASFTGSIPYDDSLCGVELDLQAIEADAGAAKSVSFTPGLQLILGR